MKDPGKKLLEVLKLQRQSFIRLYDGTKQITDPALYNQCEEESFNLQKLIGRENKKKIKKECAYPLPWRG